MGVGWSHLAVRVSLPSLPPLHSRASSDMWSWVCPSLSPSSSVVFYFPLDFIKFAVRYALSGNMWALVFNSHDVLANKQNFGADERKAAWATAQRTLHGLSSVKEGETRPDTGTVTISSNMPSTAAADAASRRAEIARCATSHFT